MNVCLIIEQGWILKGEISGETEKALKLTNASVVRSWHNGKGIGGIAKAENKDEYILDYIGDVDVQSSKILFTIPCEW